MGVLQFNGTSDRIRWTSLATALANSTDGAVTIAALFKRDQNSTTIAGTIGLAYLLAGATAEFGFGFWGSTGGTDDQIIMDIGGSTQTIQETFDSTTLSYIVAISKASGTVAPRLAWKAGPGGAWTHENAITTLANQSAATDIEIGTWNNSEFCPAHIGLVAVWEGAMSDADKEALDNNWQTSDWWSNAHGQPVFLAELNVAGASVVDLAGNASSPTVSGTTLDGAVTLDDWNFDGTGEAAGQILLATADSADGNWTNEAGSTTDLYASIDETTASNTDYIRSELSPQTSGVRVKLAAGGDPAVSTGHTINWRIAKDTTAGQTVNMTVKLYQGGGNSLGGGTLIADFDRNDVTSTFTDFTETLSGGEADAITDYADLYLEFHADVP